MYLPAATVKALATEAWQESGIAHSISDVTTTVFTKAIGGADAMRSFPERAGVRFFSRRADPRGRAAKRLGDGGAARRADNGQPFAAGAARVCPGRPQGRAPLCAGIAR